MKSYEEITNSLLERRDRYVVEQNRKRKKVMGVVTPVCSFCLVALLGLGVWQSGMFGMMPPDQTIGDATHPGIDDTVDESESQSSDHFTANNKIVIHPIDGLSDNRMNISLMINDFVEMTRDEMIDYYGIDYIPDVPADIKPWEDDRSGIYKRSGGTGEVYWDADILNYSNEDFTRSVWLEVCGFYLLQGNRRKIRDQQHGSVNRADGRRTLLCTVYVSKCRISSLCRGGIRGRICGNHRLSCLLKKEHGR